MELGGSKGWISKKEKQLIGCIPVRETKEMISGQKKNLVSIDMLNDISSYHPV